MLTFFDGERAPLKVVAYVVYLYLSGLSLRRTSRAIRILLERSHEAIRQWLHRFSNLGEALHIGPALAAVVDETAVRVSGEQAWLWIAMEQGSRQPLAVRLTWTRNILIAEGFIRWLKRRHGVRVIVADGAH